MTKTTLRSTLPFCNVTSFFLECALLRGRELLSLTTRYEDIVLDIMDTLGPDLI